MTRDLYYLQRDLYCRKRDVLQELVAMCCCSVLNDSEIPQVLRCVAVCCSVLQCVAVCCEKRCITIDLCFMKIDHKKYMKSKRSIL